MPTSTIDARPVDPGTLIVAANVRTDTKIDKTFVSSIKQHGVLVPIIATINPDGFLEVIDGQRRTLAAVEAGLPSVPVIVTNKADDSARIIAQLVVNDHRAELTDGEHAAAFKQLALFGVSADAIARKTNMPKKRVELAINVAQSDTASAALVEHDLSLDQAAVVLEFEDVEADVAALQQAAKDRQFDHVAAQIRDRRRTAAAIAAMEQQFAAAGYTILGEHPAMEDYGRTPVEPIAMIWNGGYYIDRPVYATAEDMAARTRMEPEQHASCPGRAVHVSGSEDWDEDGNLITVATYVEYCLDWVTNGHHRTSTSTGKPAKKDPADMTAAELEGAEHEKAERKRVIQNNKDWPLATEVRRTWIADTLLQQKKLPADSDLIPALWASSNLPKESYNVGLETVKKWLDITGDEWSSGAKIRRHLITGNENTATRTMLAIALSAVEDQLNDKDAWRSQAPRGLGLYLQVLASWGYDPSVLELELIAEHKKAAKK